MRQIVVRAQIKAVPNMRRILSNATERFLWVRKSDLLAMIATQRNLLAAVGMQHRIRHRTGPCSPVNVPVSGPPQSSLGEAADP
jgi:hypothetical protein